MARLGLRSSSSSSLRRWSASGAAVLLSSALRRGAASSALTSVALFDPSRGVFSPANPSRGAVFSPRRGVFVFSPVCETVIDQPSSLSAINAKRRRLQPSSQAPIPSRPVHDPCSSRSQVSQVGNRGIVTGIGEYEGKEEAKIELEREGKHEEKSEAMEEERVLGEGEREEDVEDEKVGASEEKTNNVKESKEKVEGPKDRQEEKAQRSTGKKRVLKIWQVNQRKLK